MSKLPSRIGRITAPDTRRKYHNQQGNFSARIGNYTVINPYGVYCDLPNGALFRILDSEGKYIAAFTVDRPKQSQQGEPTFFHPVTNSRTIYRNSGDIEINSVDEEKGTNADINIICNNANVTAETSSNVTTKTATINATTIIDLTSPLTKVNGNLEVTGETALSATVTSNGKDISDSHQHAQGNDSAGNSEANIAGVL